MMQLDLTVAAECAPGRALVQAVNRRFLIAEAQIRSQASPREIRGVPSATQTGSSPIAAVLLCHRLCTNTP